jgi:starvation-inducible DNA-binding protein
MNVHSDASKADLAESLGCVLASVYTLQLKVHGFHWNVKGKDFTQFHDFFEEIQQDLYGAVDELAENILKLGFDAPGSLSEMLNLSCVEDYTVHVGEPIDMTMQFLNNNETIIEKIQYTSDLAEACRELGIMDFLGAREEMHKKWAWQARVTAGLQPSRTLGKDSAGLLKIAEVVIPTEVEVQHVPVAPCCSQGCICTPVACICGPDCMCGCRMQATVVAAVAKNEKKKTQEYTKKKKPVTTSSAKRRVFFSKETDQMLKEKLSAHNEKAPSGRKAALSMLRAVYRRGAHEYLGTLSDTAGRDAIATARVDSFLRLLASGSSLLLDHSQDNDLLPLGHPKAHKTRSTVITASMIAESEAYITLKDEKEYESTEDALIAMAEYSGLSYQVIPALAAAWSRGVKDNENPFERAKNLSVSLYNSKDADLLPRRKVDSL